MKDWEEHAFKSDKPEKEGEIKDSVETEVRQTYNFLIGITKAGPHFKNSENYPKKEKTWPQDKP